jgi:hypothetical protein
MLADDYFWRGFEAVCHVLGKDQQASLRHMAKVERKPLKLLTKYFSAYRRRQADRAARTHPGTSTMQ